MRRVLTAVAVVMTAACSVVAQASANTASGSSSTGGITAAITVDYNVQSCNGSTHWQVTSGVVNWNRVNTSWLVGSANLLLISEGDTCARTWANQSQTYTLTPNNAWGGTLHAAGTPRYVSWSYTGPPNPYTLYDGGKVKFTGTYGTYTSPVGCAIAQISGLVC